MPEPTTFVAPVAADLTIDPRPGTCYFVSSREGSTYYLVAGPYASHADALLAVSRVTAIAYRMNPRSHFMAWGTCRKESHDKPTPLGTNLDQWENAHV